MIMLWASAVMMPAFAGPLSAAGQTRQPATHSTEAPLEFSGYVVDQAAILSSDDRQALTRRLEDFQRTTGHQLAVVTVASLHGEDIALFTRRLANTWGVGRKGLNDGVVVLVAPHDRQARIEVGRGLEQQLTDAFCRQVMQQRMVPSFAKGRFAQGIDAGVSALIARLAGTTKQVR